MFEGSCHRHRVITSKYQNVVYMYFLDVLTQGKKVKAVMHPSHSHTIALTCTYTSTYHVKKLSLFFHFYHSLPAQAYIHTFSKILGPMLIAPSHHSCVFMVVVFVFVVMWSWSSLWAFKKIYVVYYIYIENIPSAL